MMGDTEYKKTEIGNIPIDWELGTLKDCSKSMYQGINTVADKIEYHEQGVKILQAKHITKEFIDLEDARYVSNEDYEKYKEKFQPLVNDILISNIGTIGRVVRIEENQKFLIAWNIFLVRFLEGVDTKYISYWLKHLADINYYDEFLTGNATKFINKTVMSNIPIPIPKINEQHKISTILTSVNEAIKKTEAIIEQTEKVKKGLMQQLLTKGIGHKKFKKTEIGEIPEEWEVKELNEVVELIDGDRSSNYPKQDELVEDGILFLNTSNFKNNKLTFQSKSFITIEKFNSFRKGKLKRNDLIITLRGSVGNVVLFNCEYDTGFINAQMSILRNKIKELDVNYLYLYLTSAKMKSHLLLISTGSAQPQLPLKDLKRVRIAIPTLAEQRKIIESIYSVDKKVENEKSKLEKLHFLKHALMQVLLTGKVRVKVDEEEVTTS